MTALDPTELATTEAIVYTGVAADTELDETTSGGVVTPGWCSDPSSSLR